MAFEKLLHNCVLPVHGPCGLGEEVIFISFLNIPVKKIATSQFSVAVKNKI